MFSTLNSSANNGDITDAHMNTSDKIMAPALFGSPLLLKRILALSIGVPVLLIAGRSARVGIERLWAQYNTLEGRQRFKRRRVRRTVHEDSVPAH